jgi:O-antigen/teichoic acid export membrane protein
MLKIQLNRIIINLGIVGLSDLFARVIGFISVILIARYLGPQDYGKYSLVLSFSYIFAVFANFGIEPLTIKDVSKDKSLSGLYSAFHFLMKPISSFFFIILLNLSALGLGYGNDILICMAIFSIHILFNTLIDAIGSIFIAHEKMQYFSLVNVLNSLGGFIFIVALISFHASLIHIIISRVAVFLISFLVSLFLLLKKFPKPCFDLINKDRIKYLLQSAFPFLTIGLVSILYLNIDIIMLSKLKGEIYVGWYVPAARDLFLAIFIIPKTITTVLFPKFSRMFHESLESFTQNVNFTSKVIVMLGMGIFAGSIILAPKIIYLSFGSDYKNSIIILQIMSLGILISFINSILSYALTAAEKIKAIMWINISSLMLNVALNSFLIPLYAHIGAAISSLVCSIVSFYFTFIFLKRVAGGIQIFSYLLKPSLASVGMCMGLYFLSHMNLFFSVVIGAFIYFLILVLLRNFDESELLLLKKVIIKIQ